MPATLARVAGNNCDFDILECREPKAAGAVTPASVIWIGKTRRSAQTWAKWSLNG
jgi:hypothetical protein